MKKRYLVSALVLLALGASPSTVHAQHPVDGIEWMVQNLRDHGQPVLPSFEGWYPREDGTYDLCFGYFNLNLEEDVEIPLGPNNFIEPAEYDGMQPSFFLRVPPPPDLYRRYFCVFTVNVPADFDDRVVWTLRQDGREYVVPGHLHESAYQISEEYQFNQGDDSWPPMVEFLDPEGPSGWGRSGITTDPAIVNVGEPLPLSISVAYPDHAPPLGDVRRLAEDEQELLDPTMARRDRDDEARRIWWVKWAKHQGPPGANVSFESNDLSVFETPATVTTTATFSEPGEYLLRVQAIDNPSEGGSFQFHCCWTNGYVPVDVIP